MSFTKDVFPIVYQSPYGLVLFIGFLHFACQFDGAVLESQAEKGLEFTVFIDIFRKHSPCDRVHFDGSNNLLYILMKKKLYRIGITGGIASGKSNLLKYLHNNVPGIYTVNLDLYGH